METDFALYTKILDKLDKKVSANMKLLRIKLLVNCK